VESENGRPGVPSSAAYGLWIFNFGDDLLSLFLLALGFSVSSLLQASLVEVTSQVGMMRPGFSQVLVLFVQ
jgi:hypothetical protein